MKTLLCSLLLVFACGGSEGPGDGSGADSGVDVGAVDSGAVDVGAVDAGAGDVGAADVGAVDVGAADVGAADAGAVDVGAADVGAADAATDVGAGACEYLDLDVYIVDCSGGYTYLRRWQRLGSTEAECPDYYTLDGTRFDDLESALASGSCNAACLRRASTSVSLIRCGRRTGYIVFRAESESCGELYETPDGLFPSIEAWDEAAPCE